MIHKACMPVYKIFLADGRTGESLEVVQEVLADLKSAWWKSMTCRPRGVHLGHLELIWDIVNSFLAIDQWDGHLVDGNIKAVYWNFLLLFL